MAPTSAAGRAAILALFDAGHTPVEIASRGFQKGQVYAVLRAQRAGRGRAPRRRTSEVREKVRALRAAGLAAGRISALLGISRTWVYALLKD